MPTFGFYELDGTWGVENHGVDPDIHVPEDPAKMQNGADPQLQTAIEHLLAELQANPPKRVRRPAGPNRAGAGIPESDR